MMVYAISGLKDQNVFAPPKRYILRWFWFWNLFQDNMIQYNTIKQLMHDTEFNEDHVEMTAPIIKLLVLSCWWACLLLPRLAGQSAHNQYKIVWQMHSRLRQTNVQQVYSKWRMKSGLTGVTKWQKRINWLKERSNKWKQITSKTNQTTNQIWIEYR